MEWKPHAWSGLFPRSQNPRASQGFVGTCVDTAPQPRPQLPAFRESSGGVWGDAGVCLGGK